MDWNAAIERNREALKRILASLAAMAGFTPPLAGEDGSARRGNLSAEAQRAKAEAEALAEPGEGDSSGTRPTLPRHLHRAVLRLLRPAEAAARRLVIVIARELPAPPPLGPSRPRKPDPKAAHAALRSLGLAVFISPAEARAAALARRPRTPCTKIALPLFDPIRVPRPGRPRTVPPHAAPRILSFDGARPHRLPPPPSPNDPIDAARLGLRLQAVASALDDLPKHARRFARWKNRVAAGAQNKESRARGLSRRVRPLRPGRPPGQRPANGRRPTHEVHDVLGDLQYFAVKALESPDTS